MRRAGINPLVHHLKHGTGEGRPPFPDPIRDPLVRRLSSKYDVIILANIAWQARCQRPQQVAMQFARNGHRVFYVVAYPSMPNNVPGTYGATQVWDNVLQIRFPESCHFDHYSNILSGSTLEKFLSGINDLTQDWHIADAVLHLHLPSWVELAVALRERRLWPIIYDCMDDWDGFPGIHSNLIAAEIDLVSFADSVTVTGGLLLQKWKSRARRCELIRNGADAEFFAERCRPNNRFGFDHPVVGYYGAIADWTDLDLISDLAAQNPQWQFVLAGDIFVSDLRGLDSMQKRQAARAKAF